MKISYNWLTRHIPLSESPHKIAEMLTACGLEVESIETAESVKGGLKGLVVGHVLTCEKHPGADKLKKTTVRIGTEVVLNIVCGAPNIAAGQYVIVATPGTTLYPLKGEPFTIQKTKIRGEISEGMICAEDEIGIGASHEGIIVLQKPYEPGTPASEVFNVETDYVFEIGLTPNRADAASHLGVARDLRALLDRNLITSFYEVSPNNNSSKTIHVSVEDAKACPRYCGLVIEGVKIAPSPAWLQKKLKAIGLAPINNVVDATNFILHDLGQPLHAFDTDKISGGKIIVKKNNTHTAFTTLDKTERKIHPDDLMICDAEKPLCIAGVMGGLNSAVTQDTTNIFLESAYFLPSQIRTTAQRHQLKTDSSFRFERGTDPDIPLKALQNAAHLILEIAGGKIAGPIIDLYPHPIQHSPIQISYSYLQKITGISIPKDSLKRILHNLDITIKNENDDELYLAVPPRKIDVQRPADIAEEILRIYGFDNVPLQEYTGTPFIAQQPEKNITQVEKVIGSFLAARGFHEIITNSLTHPKYSTACQKQDSAIYILNRLSEDLETLRQTLLFSMLETARYNLNRKQNDLKFFEFGKTYHKQQNEYIEKEYLALLATGNQMAQTWQQKEVKVDFHYLNSIVLCILEKLNIQPVGKVADNVLLQHAYAYSIEGKLLATIGKVSPKILNMLDLKQDAYYAEFDKSLLIQNYSPKVSFKEINKHPEVRRDLSLIVDKHITFAQIRELAMKKEKKLISDINVFDLYEGKNIGEGKKAYAISFILQDYEQTLTDNVIDKTMQKLMSSFESELGAVIRK
ncbi:MAG: phenylalanine--tRNA ligase subunit beta [Cytophagaceae bacterium]|nr:phenylalanine--tRNA ligase subunit beta [Cytophagaceae bacterium]MDW8455954.1 phenylalanine--tRNA ligase subunit beta [Cytophagaceae bacterium]